MKHSSFGSTGVIVVISLSGLVVKGVKPTELAYMQGVSALTPKPKGLITPFNSFTTKEVLLPKLE